MERTVEAVGDADSVGTTRDAAGQAGVAEHALSLDGEQAAAELAQLARGARRQLARLQEAGVSGVPRSKASPRRADPTRSGGRYDFPGPAPAAAAATSAAASTVAEHAMPAITAAAARVPVPSPPPARPSLPPVASTGRGFQLVETSHAELPAPGVLRGREGLAELARLLGDCQRCKLCHGRNHIVFADGSPEATLAFVGEGPGADEDRLGRPFVGAAGQLLDRMIDAMAAEAKKRGHAELAAQLSRQAVYICNVVKCRPPGNRTPELDEMAACAPFLRRQLLALRPRLRAIVALGRTPTQYLLRSTAPISGLRGHFTPWEGIPVMPTYHPAYLLRTPSAKRQVWEDLQKVIAALAQPESTTAAGPLRSAESLEP